MISSVATGLMEVTKFRTKSSMSCKRKCVVSAGAGAVALAKSLRRVSTMLYGGSKFLYNLDLSLENIKIISCKELMILKYHRRHILSGKNTKYLDLAVCLCAWQRHICHCLMIQPSRVDRNDSPFLSVMCKQMLELDSCIILLLELLALCLVL